MDDEQFGQEMEAWRMLPSALETCEYLGYPHPLDAKIDALCRLYLDATPAQRDHLAAVAIPAELDRGTASRITTNLLSYIRRCGRRLRDARDVGLLRLGIAAATLAGERADLRDLAVALVFLRAGAARAGISPSFALRILDETVPANMPPTLPAGSADVAEFGVRQVIGGVFRSDEATITRIVAYHMGTG